MEVTKIEVFKRNEKKYIKFIFSGRLEPNDADTAIIQWKEIFSKDPGIKYIVIWDCVRMQGYDHEARKKWQTALSELEKQIDFIWIITQSTMFKMGAQVMALLTNLNLKVVDTEDNIKY
ncbi:MAG: hypothetical protein P8Y99_06030 [Calditrichaceae bacterium]|jgi:hypothetical protein